MQLRKAAIPGLCSICCNRSLCLQFFSSPIFCCIRQAAATVIKWSFRDFYDYYENLIFIRHTCQAFYLIFAIWNIRSSCLASHDISNGKSACSAILWAKLLPCLIYVASGVLIYHIAILAGMGSKRNQSFAYGMPYYASCFLCAVYLWPV